MWQYYVALVFSAAANAFAQFVIKIGVGGAWGPEDSGLWDRFGRGLSNGPIWAGVGIMAVSLVAYMYSLGKVEVSIAAPVAAGLVTMFVVLFGWWLLPDKEKLAVLQLVGFAVIVLGVWLVSRGEFVGKSN